MRVVDRRSFSFALLAAASHHGAPFTKPAFADLPSAAAGGMPLLGRFEPLKGANAFIGQWEFSATEGPSAGILTLSRTGDVELLARDSTNKIIALSTEPWTYVSTKGKDTMVRLRFNLDVNTVDYGVLTYQGTVDSAGGPERAMEGTIISEYGRQIGGFLARPRAQE